MSVLPSSKPFANGHFSACKRTNLVIIQSIERVKVSLGPCLSGKLNMYLTRDWGLRARYPVVADFLTGNCSPLTSDTYEKSSQWFLGGKLCQDLYEKTRKHINASLTAMI